MMKFFKSNEKVIMVVLLAIIAPSFAFTGLMFTAIEQAANNPPVLALHGKTIGLADYRFQQAHVAQVNKVFIFMLRGFVTRGGATMDQVIQHELLMHRARAEGMVATDEEVGAAARETGKRLIAMHRVLRDRNDLDLEQAFQEINQRAQATPFTSNDYRLALMAPEVGMRLSVAEYEDLLREVLTKEKVIRAYSITVPVSEREVYEEYERQNQLRVLDLVRLSTESFLAEARTQAAADEARLRDYYEANGVLFRTGDQVQLEIAQVTPAGRNQFEPSEELLQQIYERDKELRFKAPVAAADPAAPTADPPPAEYKAFEDVRSELMATARYEQMNTELNAALQEGKRRSEAGEEFALPDLFGSYVVCVEVTTTGWFGSAEVPTLPASYRNDARLRELFFRFQELQPGMFGNSIVPLGAGDYIYRIHAVRAAQQPEFDESREQVVEKVALEIAGELAMQKLTDWTARLQAEPDITLASLAESENLKVHRTEPVGRSDFGKLRVDERMIGGAFGVLTAAFEIPEVGKVSEPVVAPDNSEVYLVALVETRPPDSGRYEQQRTSLLNTLRNERIEFASAEFLRKLQAEANVTMFGVEEDPEDVDEGS